MFDWDQPPPIIEEATKDFDTPRGVVRVQMHASAELIASLTPDPGLHVFHPPAVMHRVLIDIARSIDGAVVIAYHVESRTLVGFIAFHPPDVRVRWGQKRIPHIIELEAIEVSSNWRRMGISEHMFEVAFSTHYFDDKVVISTEYAWHWDLSEAGLTKEQYANMLRELFMQNGFQEFETDEPNIQADPANLFMVRIGNKVSPETIQQFTALLKTNRQVGYKVTVQGPFKRFTPSI